MTRGENAGTFLNHGAAVRELSVLAGWIAMGASIALQEQQVRSRPQFVRNLIFA